MEEGAVSARADLVDDIGLKVDVEGAGDVFARAAVQKDERVAPARVNGRDLSEKKVEKPPSWAEGEPSRRRPSGWRRELEYAL